MILILKLIVLTSIWVIGIKIATGSGMLLGKLGSYGEAKIKDGKKVYKTLWVCEWCMPSIHSLIGYSFAIGLGVINSFSWSLVVMYPIVVMGSSFVSGMSWLMYILVSSKNEYYVNAQKYYYLTNKKLKDGSKIIR